MIQAGGHGPSGWAGIALATLLSAASIAACSSASSREPGARVATAPPSATSPPAMATARRPAGLLVSSVSPNAVQPQPPPGSCHAGGSGVYSLPDPHCTPGAITSAVTQANIQSTICGYGYTDTVRPPASVSEPEKEASLAAYGGSRPLHDYEYDHLVPLELGGAPNDPRNLWPEPGASPNPKDAVEDQLRQQVCDGRISLARAQRAIAANWVLLARPRRSELLPGQGSTPRSSPAATCTATSRYNRRYDDWDVYVHSDQPSQTVTVSGRAETKKWHTDSSGYADVYFNAGRSAAREQITVQVGAATCSTAL